MLPGIHFFDAHRLQPQLLSALKARNGPRSKLQNGYDGADYTVQDTFSDDESTTTDLNADAEELSDDSLWCPPTPDTPDDPTELEIASVADNLDNDE